MFERLIQADRSMSDGLLDQAERTYWQLIELDPTNAIAVACLARISLKRGDARLARTFADRAIGIDPDSIVARKVIHALEEGSALPEDSSTPDINLRGAERLEALSRRRSSQLGGDEGGEGGEGAAWSGWARTSGRGKPAQLPAPVRAPMPGSVKPVRGRTQSDQLEPRPAEPLRERRKTGRLAAAAAVAAAAARELTHTRHEPHRAMPTGRRMFEPRPVNAAPDPFAAAEMAAVIAAVDAMDEPYESEPSAELAAEEAAQPEPKVPDRELAAASSPESDADQAERSEEDAETQALREAMTIVLPAQNVDDTAGEPRADLEDPAATPDPTETEPQTHSAEAPPDANAPEEAAANHDSAPRKKGLFRRFRG